MFYLLEKITINFMTAKIYGTLKVCDENYEDGIGFGIVG
jgi:hypothetical protein